MIQNLEKIFTGAGKIEILVALALVVIATIYLITLVFGKSRHGPEVTLLVGPCGSGKTTLFYKWTKPDMKVRTVTSQSVNRAKYNNKELVDYPGHPRLRGGIGAILPRANRIVFLVDSATPSLDEYNLAAEFLYDLLVHPALRRDARMMIACNKSDLKCARDANEMKKILDLQIERLRKSRMEGFLEGDNAVDQYLGVDGEEFDLVGHSPIPVEFATASVAQSKVSDIQVFIR